MPRLTTDIDPATAGGPRTPGIWLCTIKRQTKSGDPGIKTHDNGSIITTRSGDEMWKLRPVVIDDHPEAPAGLEFFDNAIWEGKGAPRAYALIQAMGHPLGEWQKAGREVTAEDLYDRPYCVDMRFGEPNDKGNVYLEPYGFMPYRAADDPGRGPHAPDVAGGSAAASQSGGGGGGRRAAAKGSRSDLDDIPF